MLGRQRAVSNRSDMLSCSIKYPPYFRTVWDRVLTTCKFYLLSKLTLSLLRSTLLGINYYSLILFDAVLFYLILGIRSPLSPVPWMF